MCGGARLIWIKASTGRPAHQMRMRSRSPAARRWPSLHDMVSAMPIGATGTAFGMLALLLAGCSPQSPRPNFLARSMQDCASGDQQACAMLGSFSAVPASGKISEPADEPRQRTQAEKDADAIMEGMRKARSSPTVQNWKIAPTRRDS